MYHKTGDRWKIGNMWKKGAGVKYGGMLWVNYGRDLRAGYAFDHKDYGVDYLWVILNPPAAPGKTKAGKR